MLRNLKFGVPTGLVLLLLSALPVRADNIVGLGPSSSGTVTITFNATTQSYDVTLPSTLSGSGYEFDSGGTNTTFVLSGSPSGQASFSSSDQGTTLSLAGQPSGTPVTWTDIGGGNLPGILIMQFTTPLQSGGTTELDDLVLNITSLSVTSQSSEAGGTLSFSPGTFTFNLLQDDSTPIWFNEPSFSGSGFVEENLPCPGLITLAPGDPGTQLNPLPDTAPCPTGANQTVTAAISSGEVFVATSGSTSATSTVPEPSSIYLLGSGLASLMGMGLLRKRFV